jgi:aromatic-L-amino-acid/L-tryptophan decarboxylase
MSERDERQDSDAEQKRPTRAVRASRLDEGAAELPALSAQMQLLVADYFAQLAELPVFPETSALELSERLGRELPVEGSSVEQIVDDCRAVINGSRHNGHPRFFGYVASPSTPIGAYADLLASALNVNVTSWRSAPSATVIEKTVVRWLSALIGYGGEAHGLLTSGGSMANLNALLIAHRSRSPEGVVSRRGLWSTGAPMTLYASEQVHMSIPKAADILGLGRDHLRLVKADERFRLDVRDLRELLEADSARSLTPFCVVASAGTVNTGAVDPLAEIARVAESHNLWFHVDGAYGAFGALDESKRTLFDGIEHADSVSLDPHKWLYAPVDVGCLLFRNPEQVRRALQAATDADYIKVQEETSDESFAFWDYGIELSRRFRALKVWMMLSYYGARRVRAAISEDNELASYLAERVRGAEDFELLAPVELSICCFRYVPPRVRERLDSADDEERARLNRELDALNAALMHRVQRGGRAYLSNVTLKGLYGLRACIVNFRTTRDDIDQTLDILRDAAREVSDA